jgi:hypothetical protein
MRTSTAPVSPTTSADHCDYNDCPDGWVSIINVSDVRLSVREACFGYVLPSCYAEWRTSPQSFRLCRKHLRAIRRSDGITIGYRMHKGQLTGYVKEEHF